MSQAKVVRVERARAEYRCEKDGTAILKGDPYRWYVVGFRSKYRHIRCTRQSCTPKPSELESSQLSEVYAAQEAAVADLGDMSTSIEPEGAKDLVDEVKSHLQTAADSIREVADAYREADEQFGGGGMTDSGERADTLDEAVDALESWEPDDDADDIDGCGEHEDDEPPKPNGFDPECVDCQDLLHSWAGNVVDDAIGLVEEIELP